MSIQRNLIYNIQLKADKAMATLDGFKNKLKSAVESVSKVGKSAEMAGEKLSSMGLAGGRLLGILGKLASHPIIAILAALAGAIQFVTESLKTNEDAMQGISEIMSLVTAGAKAASKWIGEKVAAAFKEAGGAAQWFQDRLDDVIDFYEKSVLKIKKVWISVKGFFSGGPTDEMLESLVEIEEQIKKIEDGTVRQERAIKRQQSETYKLAQEYLKLQKFENAMVKQRRVYNIEIAATNKSIQSERNLMNDMNKTLRQREEHAKNVRVMILEQADAQENMLNKEIALVSERIRLEGKSTKNLDDMNKLEVQRLNLLAAREQQIYTLNAFEARLIAERRQIEADITRQRIENEQKATDMRIAIHQNEVDILRETQRGWWESESNAIEDWENKQIEALSNLELSHAEYNKRLIAITEERERREVELNRKKVDALLMSTAGLFGALSQMGDENHALMKGFAVAEAVINTWVAFVSALRTPVPFEPMRYINAAAALAAGFSAVKNILATDKKGNGGGAASAPTPPEVVNVAPDLQGGPGQEIRAYIVEDDLAQSSTNKKLSENIGTF